jgi:orotate phosphoribosyltransferase-like protein
VWRVWRVWRSRLRRCQRTEEQRIALAKRVIDLKKQGLKSEFITERLGVPRGTLWGLVDWYKKKQTNQPKEKDYI